MNKLMMKLKLFAAVVAGAMALGAQAESILPFFSRQAEIAFPGAPETPLENFPVLIKVSPETISGFVYAACAADGADVRFADDNGEAIAFEWERWDPNGTSLAWVRVPSLSSATKIRLFWSPIAELPAAPAASSVWSGASTVVVDHFTSSATHKESSANGFSMTANGTLSLTDGVIGNAINGTAANSSFKLAASSTWANVMNSTFTLSCWIKVSTKSEQWARLLGWGHDSNQGGNGLYIGLNCAETACRSFYFEGAKASSYASPVGVLYTDWMQVTFVANKATDTLTVYVNGEQVGETPSSTAIPLNGPSNRDMVLMAGYNCNNGYIGQMDEFRIESAVRNAAWVKASYDTAHAHTTFTSYGAAKELDSNYVSVPKLMAEALSWTGEEVAPQLSSTSHLVVSGDLSATDEGAYEITVVPAEGYLWPDDTNEPRMLRWTLFRYDFATTTFLKTLAESPKRVGSSPYAVGGDCILKDGDDYIHVFCAVSSEGHAFTSKQAMMARVLAVGGGGAGGAVGGGGGGGGMLDSPTVAFGAADYTVMVGKGGTWPRADLDKNGDGWTDNWNSTRSARYSGSASYIATAEGTDVIRALGGGGGGSAGATSGLGGGSGGGSAYGSSSVGLGTSGQGNNGGSGAASTNGSGGGGGAGGKGGDAGSGDSNGAAGGIGKASDICGFEQKFAGGGGGGCQPSWTSGGAAGEGGGGRGPTSWDANNIGSGVNGLGGGGGGSGGQPGNVRCMIPGDGGSGIVVIRYTDPALASTVPQIALNGVQTNANATATLSWELMGSGDIAVSAIWGYSSDALVFTNEIATSVASGAASAALGGLLPGRTYSAALIAENEKGEVSEPTAILSFTMPADGAVPEIAPPAQPVVADVGVRDRTGGDYVLVDVSLGQPGTDCAFEGCTVILRWGTQNSYASLASSSNLLAAADGTVTLRPNQLGTGTYYACVEVVNANGFVDRTSIFTFTANDISTYMWKEGVTDGAWENPKNWTGAPNDWGLGYPMNNANADFTSVLCATVHVSTAVSCNWYRKERFGGEYVFIGDTDAASISTKDCHPTARNLQGNQKLVFDHIKVAVATLDVGRYSLGVNDVLILTNNASLTPKRGGSTITGVEATAKNCRLALYRGSGITAENYGCIFGGEGVEVLVSGGSSIWANYDMTFNAGLSLTIDNATVSANNLNLSSSGAAPTVTLRGANPVLEGKTSLRMSSDQGVKIVSEIPVAGWTSGARFTGKPGSPYNGSIILSVPRSAPIRKSTVKTASESKIVYMSSGIDVAKVAFGPTAKVLDYFYFTDAEGNAYRSAADVPEETTITGVNYHHERTPGFAVIVR